MKLLQEKLKGARMAFGLTQADMAASTGLQQKDISALESGKRKFLPNDYILFLYKCGVNLNSLFDDNVSLTFGGIVAGRPIDGKATTQIEKPPVHSPPEVDYKEKYYTLLEALAWERANSGVPSPAFSNLQERVLELQVALTKAGLYQPHAEETAIINRARKKKSMDSEAAVGS